MAGAAFFAPTRDDRRLPEKHDTCARSHPNTTRTTAGTVTNSSALAPCAYRPPQYHHYHLPHAPRQRRPFPISHDSFVASLPTGSISSIAAPSAGSPRIWRTANTTCTNSPATTTLSAAAPPLDDAYDASRRLPACATRPAADSHPWPRPRLWPALAPAPAFCAREWRDMHHGNPSARDDTQRTLAVGRGISDHAAVMQVESRSARQLPGNVEHR
ncbi:hypothetical protein B0H13DRAFT_2404362 [Mycena leptocephala]|nr:hypothetical protein B0H13DRAFT_2404362 [Mycena leptocephala]